MPYFSIKKAFLSNIIHPTGIKTLVVSREVWVTILKKNPPSRLRKQDGRFSFI